MGKADLHAHTCHDNWGDGNQTVSELFRHVEEETDLDIFAITDHDSTDAARAAWSIYQKGSYRFSFIPGVEITNLGGHLLCYFPSGEIVDVPSLRPFWWTVRFVHERDGICIPAHLLYPPWVSKLLHRGLEQGLEVDAIEAVNTGISEKAQARLDRLVEPLASQFALVGNSDAHEATAIGSAFTRFPGRSVDDLLRAMKQRETQPVYVHRPRLEGPARSFTNHRSRTRPGWVRNLWREMRGQTG